MSHNVKKEFIFGFHAITALLKSHPERICQLYRQEGREDKRMLEILQLAEYQQIPIQTLSKIKCDGWAQGAVHQGVLAEIKISAHLNERDLFSLVNQRLANETSPPFLSVLDEVQDPHNLGACIRSANAAGADAVIIPQDRSVKLDAQCAKNSCRCR